MAGSSLAAPIPIAGYDITDAVMSGFGGWSHTYSGTITPGTSFTHIGDSGRTAVYSGGGSGTLNDGIIGTTKDDTQLFVAPDALAFPDGPSVLSIHPTITLFLSKLSDIGALFIFSRNAEDSQGAFGALDKVTVSLVGPGGVVSHRFDTIGFGPLNGHGIPENDLVVLVGTGLEHFVTSAIVLSDFAATYPDPNVENYLFISEIAVDGSLGEPPAFIALALALIALTFARSRRKTARA